MPFRPAALMLLAGLLSIQPAAVLAEGVPLQLAVMLNGRDTGLVASFLRGEEGRLSATRKELREIGLAPDAGSEEDSVELDALGVSYVLDDAGQIVTIDAGEARLRPNRVDLGPPPATGTEAASAGYGAVVNYSLFGSATSGFEGPAYVFNGASAFLDGRFYSPFGYVRSGGLLAGSPGDRLSAVRLDTTYVYSDETRAMRYSAGDVITGAPAWGRSLRLGGAQVERAFELRPDLVTAPLPSVTGTAAVPSTVDVFVGNVRRYSADIPAGPFEVANLPMISGQGAQVIVRDATGREVTTSLSFFANQSMLRKGLLDFSLAAGVARYGYAARSFDYGEEVLASGTMRYGLTDSLTATGFAQYGAGLTAGSIGFTTNYGGLGVLTLAGSASALNGEAGYQAYGAFSTEVLGVRIDLSSQRSFGAFADLVSATARRETPRGAILDNPDSLFLGQRPARALDRLAFSMQIPALRGGVSAGYIHFKDNEGARSRIVTASLTGSLRGLGDLNGSVFADLGGKRSIGGAVRLSRTIGETGPRIDAGYLFDRVRSAGIIAANQSLGLTPGSFGWGVEVLQGRDESYQSAYGSYRSGYGVATARVRQARGYFNGEAGLDGAIVLTGDGIFAADRIDQAFAIVDVGAPDVEVLYQNRPIGRTGRRGKIVVPNLVSGQNNRLEIDPAGLPLDASIAATSADVRPMPFSGARVDFGVGAASGSVTLVLSDAEGRPLDVGLQGTNQATGETFTIGYDGEVYLARPAASNGLEVEMGKGRRCAAAFDAGFSNRRLTCR